jgi:hypothetical protein
MAGAERGLILGNYEFNPYAAGAKIYNGVASSPTRGAVDKTGYAARDRKLQAKKNAVLAKMKAMQNGAYANSNVQRFVK